MTDFFAQAAAALAEPDPARKLAALAALAVPAVLPDAPLDRALDARIPGRPARPVLVSPQAVPRRGFGNAAARVATVHAIAHIEFNAINLALDACWRFRGLPADYYRDWLSVAHDEARHFGMLQGRLRELGHDYGDFDAHDGLWDAAAKTRDDLLARMALVPRGLEARGLDATPGLIAKLEQAGDTASAALLRVILAEEVRHVAIGTHWFRHLCVERGLEPDETFVQLLRAHGLQLRPPFNRAARAAAGFSSRELAG